MAVRSSIKIVGAKQHNLKSINVSIPRGAFTVITGPSGSGKSSLAFDTIYAEGQRRYVESLSAYARQFLEQMPKPDVDRMEGLPPTIAIEQRLGLPGPRSSVGTTTEIHDYLRVLFARMGEPRCWRCDRPIVKQSIASMVDAILTEPEGRRVIILAPLVRGQRGAHKAILARIIKEGFVRARIDGTVIPLEELQDLSGKARHTIEVIVDRLVVKPGIETRLADSLETAAQLSGGQVLVTTNMDDGSWAETMFSATLTCPAHADVRMNDLTPQLFSFNSPHGACEKCTGLGTTLELDPGLIVPDPDMSLSKGAIAAWRRQGKRLNSLYAELLQDFCQQFKVLPDVPFRNIPEARKRILMEGTTEGDVNEFGATFEGVIPNLRRRWETTESNAAKKRLHAFLSETPCGSCAGRRLNHKALSVKINGLSLADVTAMNVTQAAAFFQSLKLQGEQHVLGKPLVDEIVSRLRFLRDVGVAYLTLDRASATLSGGEWQRIRLATQLGSSLAGVCYVLDEPTIGLHPRDSGKLIAILKRLADMENTVIVVEHDEEVIRAADYIIDLGPGAGTRGGEIVAEGTLDEILTSKRSATARFLTGRSKMATPEARRPVDLSNTLEISDVCAHNLKHVDVRFPLGLFVCVTGVSGSGKSTLVNHVLLRALQRLLKRTGPQPGAFGKLVGGQLVEDIVEIDQAPIGRTPRSNPATYVGVFELIRQLYAQTREAKIRGYGAPRFSFNVKGGRCESCEGQGTKRIAMHFLPDVFVTCGECGGARYNRETLDVRFRGITIADVLNLQIDEALTFFDSFAKIRRRLQSLKDVGLGYMSLGQPSNTLSGGEAQRVKLASELHRTIQGHTLYVLDEPTTGLHFADVRNLVALLQRLVDRSHTVVVIEHNLDVIQAADWIIDLGPEGGEDGGRIVVEGTPETIASCEQSYTGQYLRARLGSYT